MSVTSPTTQTIGGCPCESDRCEIVGTKLNRAGHVVGCKCFSCQGKRNRKKGQAGEARAHKRLGGVGGTIRDDLFHCYSVNHSVESKVGAAQIPASFVSFVHSEKARVWWNQAEKKTPVGSDALPTLYIELTPGEWYLVTKGEGTLR